MVTETRVGLGSLAFSLLLSACVSSSIRSDLASVRALSQAERLPAVPEGRVSPGTSDDVRSLLRKPLDAQAAVRIALLNNRELRAQLRELGVARGRVMQAGLIANPIFEVEALPERDSDLELRVEYDITSLVLAPLRKQAEAHELEARRTEVAAAVVQLGYDVRRAFYALQAAEQRLGLAQRTLDALAAARDAAVALRDAGNIPALDAANQIAAYERARIVVAQIELEVAERREAAQRLLGLHGEETHWSVVPALDEAPEELLAADDLEVRALEANLDLKATQKRLDAVAKRTGVARTAGFLPEVAVDVHSLRVDTESGGAADQEFRWGGGVSLGVPLFDRNQGTRRSLNAQFDALLERFQGKAIDVRSTARELRSRLRSAHARARQYQTVILPAQREVVQQTLLQYNAMQVGVFQLLLARRELLNVELAYVDTLREYWGAHAALEALLAGHVVGMGTTPSVAMDAAVGAGEGGH